MSIIDKPTDYFETKLYTGTGSELAITGVGFQPDWVWTKSRSNTLNHNVYDSVRGVNKGLKPNTADSEFNDAQSLKSFNSDGFTVGTDSHINTSSATFASWNWKETADAGFDIVSYTGNGSARTLSHSLSAIPKMIIVKNLTSATSWHVYHNSIGATKYLQLNSTNAEGTASSVWNDTAPTSSVFSIGSGDGTNKNTDNIIAYLFAEKQGYSKFGSYKGNGNADGSFIFTGQKSAFIMIKAASRIGTWNMYDTKRNTFNNIQDFQIANVGEADVTGNTYQNIDILSNGFKCYGTGTGTNENGATYIYMAFAENPFVTSSGVPACAR